MGEKRFMISDASKMLNVESHVLRYWEEELEINIPRNEMGHRYYTQFHVNLLKNVRDLKRQGFGLKAIKMMITDPPEGQDVDNLSLMESKPSQQTMTKLDQFQEIMNDIVGNAIKNSTADLSKELSKNVSDSVMKGMNYLMRVQDEREEERYKKLDAMMRSKQKLTRKEKKRRAKAEKMLLKPPKTENRIIPEAKPEAT